MTIFKYIIFDFKNNNINLIKKENLFFNKTLTQIISYNNH